MPEKALFEEFWADILEVSGQVNERYWDGKGWKEDMEASLGDLQPCRAKTLPCRGLIQKNSRRKVDATNTLAIPLLRYRFVTLKWTRGELRDLDVLTQ